jgi:hypothetical protein
MTERLDRSRSGHRTARGHRPQAQQQGIPGGPPLPAPPPSYLSAESDPTILGFPAEGAETDGGAEITEGAPEISRSPALVIVRRPDPLGATALVLAGVAATVSLLWPWLSGDGPSGLALVDRGARELGSGAAGALWQPFALVLCGGILVVLGFLMMVPARAHRVVGVLALLVTLTAAASVVFLVIDTDLTVDRFGPGLWCAAAVPVLGLLGALKAMLTAPRVLLAPDGRRAVRARPRTVS